MRIDTEFDIGDIVWGATVREMSTKVPCALCEGSGRVDVVGIDVRALCPGDGCHMGYVKGGGEKVGFVQELTLGSCMVERERRSADSPIVHAKEGYMAWETGVGTGRRWYVESLRVNRSEVEAWAYEQGADRIEEVAS